MVKGQWLGRPYFFIILLPLPYPSLPSHPLTKKVLAQLEVVLVSGLSESQHAHIFHIEFHSEENGKAWCPGGVGWHRLWREDEALSSPTNGTVRLQKPTHGRSPAWRSILRQLPVKVQEPLITICSNERQ